MQKILLVFPHPSGVFPRIPTSVLPLAGYLEERGYIVEIFDEQVDDIDKINPTNYDLIGFSVPFTSRQIRNALSLARYFRKEGSIAPFVWGGTHPTITPEQTVQNEYVDVVVRGEGEVTLYELIEAFSASGKMEDVKGITFRRNGRVISTPDRSFIDLDNLPLLPFHLLKNPWNYSERKRKPPIAPIITSRGCPFNCGFCYVDRVHKRKWRPMSPERVIKEIKHTISFFSVDHLATYDDNFFANTGRVEQIARLIIKEGLKIRWTGSIRFDVAAKLPNEFWELLISSGFYNPSFGGESGSTRILEMINKRISISDIGNTVRAMNRFKDIYPYANFMFGLPGEKHEDVMKTFELIDQLSKENKRFSCGISVYTPYPKTPLYNESVRNGFLPPSTLEEWGNYQYNEVDNLPWLNGSQKNTIRTVSLFVHFKFNQLFLRNIDVPRKNILYIIVYILLSLSAKIRWKLKFFRLPLEWRLYEGILRAIRIVER